MELGDAKEAQVGGVKQCNSKREPGTHDEILDAICNGQRHSGSNRICDLCHDPVQMQEDDGSKGQWQTTNSKDRQVPVKPAKEHTRGDSGRPCRTESDVEYSNSIPFGRLWWEVVNGKAWREIHVETLVFDRWIV